MTGMTLRLVTALLPVLYFALAVSGSHGAASAPRPRARRIVAVLAIVLHAASFQLIHLETGASPLVIPGVLLSALALAMFVVYAWVEWMSQVRSLAGVVLSGVCVIQLAASAVGFSPVGEPPAASPLFLVHVSTTIVSVATLLLAGFFGIVYLVVEKEMRAQHFGALFARLPKLSELSAMNRRAATVGFLFMTVGYNLGIWQAHDTGRKGFSYLDPVVVLTMAAWLVFGIIAVSGWVRFLSGRKAAVTAVCGLVLIALTIVVSVVPGLSFHRLS